MRGLYIHIPFCKSICSYCDFPKLVSKKTNHEKYIDYLINEINTYSSYLDTIDTIYIGGGTPNSIELSLLERVLIRIHPYLKKSKENTIELNPELITNDLAKLLYKYNINRVSLGVQTINDKSIKLLGRHHNKEIVKTAVDILKSNNIYNINIDLIFGIPNTTITDIYKDLEFVLSLDPTHISYYSFILEDKTIFSHLISKGELKLLEDDEVADMFEYINQTLKKADFIHYEISNYSKPGYNSLHNIKYWTCKEYIGVGMGASGYLDSVRYTNKYSIKEYYESRIDSKEYIDTLEKKREYLMLGLRMLSGVSISKYSQIFDSDMFKDFNLSKLLEKNLLTIENDYVKIPESKLFIANLIFEEFVGD